MGGVERLLQIEKCLLVTDDLMVFNGTARYLSGSLLVSTLVTDYEGSRTSSTMLRISSVLACNQTRNELPSYRIRQCNQRLRALGRARMSAQAPLTRLGGHLSLRPNYIVTDGVKKLSQTRQSPEKLDSMYAFQNSCVIRGMRLLSFHSHVLIASIDARMCTT